MGAVCRGLSPSHVCFATQVTVLQFPSCRNAAPNPGSCCAVGAAQGQSEGPCSPTLLSILSWKWTMGRMGNEVTCNVSLLPMAVSVLGSVDFMS